MQAAPDPPAGSPLLLPQRTGAPCFFPELRGRRQFVPAAVPTAPQWGIGATHLGAARERPTTHTHPLLNRNSGQSRPVTATGAKAN